ILLATNFLLYAVTWSSQPHAYAFFVIAAFCWYTIQFSKNTAANSFYLCMMLVLAALLLTMRPQNILILLLLPFFGFFNKSFKEFLSSVFSFWGITGILLACFIIFRVNYYWYMQTGRLVLNPYTGEHFYFNNPHFFETLFSFRKGWLLYSPWVVLGLAGIFFIPGLKKKLNLLFFWIILIYIFSSWWCWTYSPTSFGQRVYIDFYCLIALTSGLLFEFLHRRKLLWTATIILILAIPLNIHQMYQYRKGIITSDFYHAEVYFKNFFVTRRIAQFPIPPDIIDFKKTHALHFQNGSGTVSVKKPFSGSFKVPVPPQMKPDHCSFLRMRAKLLVTEGSRPLNLVADFHTKGRSAFYKAFEISRHNFPVNTKSEFEAGMNIPENISECDSVLIYVWRPDAPGKDSCQVKNISIEFIHVDPSYELK
ncbi:MAG TPA: hypothetical protein VI731_12350, partial [Bacteroidia bacterium]|nr:hypothetical protein [Bacteroidia bacterium]